MAAPQAPVAALADAEAWQAHGDYPQLSFGGPVFGVAREREHGGWELHRGLAELAPQDARDNMGAHFRRLAQGAGQSGDQAGYEECMAAAERMDWEAINDMTVLGTRYRVVRADTFIRSGPAGPEPPRPTDPDPGEPGRAHELADPAAGFMIDPVTATGMAEGIVRLELLEAVYPEGAVPPEVRAGSVRAARTHPGGVLLPPAYTTAELSGRALEACRARDGGDAAGRPRQPDVLPACLRSLAARSRPGPARGVHRGGGPARRRAR